MDRNERKAKAGLVSVIFSIAWVLVSATSGLAHQDTNGDGLADTLGCGDMPALDRGGCEPSQDGWLWRDNTWINMGPDEHPIARYYFAMAADRIEHKAVLFGGLGYVDSVGDYRSLNDTWTYDLAANTWERANPSVSPPPRYGHEIVYSPEDSVIVLFGGADPYHQPPVVYNDIWLYRTTDDTWTEMQLSSLIPARAFHSLAFDCSGNRVIVFGGYNWLTTQWFNDTWTYEIGTSICFNQNPATPPSVRDCQRMVYDEWENVVVMFGGWHPPQELGDTWVYDLGQNTWTANCPAPSPPPRMSFAMTYEGAAAGAVIYGGGRMPPLFSDTWLYAVATNEWMNLNPSAAPSPRHRMPMAGLDFRIVLFGGYSAGGQLGDTWVYEPPMAAIDEPGGDQTIEGHALLGRIPNPVQGKEAICYCLPVAGEVRLAVYDALGRRVRTLVNGFERAGYRELVWDGRDDAGTEVTAGIYLAEIQAAGRRETQRIVILR
ncbi:MAG: hypothetical protein KAY24_11550 [Candidatus Eisenbacteria sp.]|nr:hypothetical protein [Candidatus Eisenbacteria bacterium]